MQARVWSFEEMKFNRIKPNSKSHSLLKQIINIIHHFDFIKPNHPPPDGLLDALTTAAEGQDGLVRFGVVDTASEPELIKLLVSHAL